MGKSTKDFVKQLTLSVIIGLVTGLGGGYIIVTKTQAQSNERINQNIRDIQELKDCSNLKVDKSMFDYALGRLDDRLARFEDKIDQIDTKIDNLKK